MPPLPGALSQLTPTLLASSLKAEQLRRIAKAIGAPSSGIKTSLANGIFETLGRSRFPPRAVPVAGAPESDRPVRILSVDMGIRNLAVCLLEIRPPLASDTTSRKLESPVGPATYALIPHVLAWRRMSIPLVSYPISAAASTSTSASTSSTSTEFPHTTKTEKAHSTSSPPNPFSKSAFSHHTYNLALTLLNLGGPGAQPDQVIIETQRYRSQAGAAVLEWTLRVNMLEDMLWGCLRTLENLGFWGRMKLQTPTPTNAVKKSREKLGMGAESIMGVNPSKVARFWDWCMEQYSAWEWKGKEKLEALWYQSKRSKTRMVAEMLHPMIGDATPQLQSPSSSTFPVPFYFSTAQAMETANLFRATEATTKPPKSKKNPEVGIAGIKKRRKGPKGKLDDLADCFLQGLAWVKWEEERRRILSGKAGLEVFKALGEPGEAMGDAKGTAGPKTKRARKPVAGLEARKVERKVRESLGRRGKTKKQQGGLKGGLLGSKTAKVGELMEKHVVEEMLGTARLSLPGIEEPRKRRGRPEKTMAPLRSSPIKGKGMSRRKSA